MPAIKPNEVMATVASSIPEFVIEVFNDLIKKHFNGYSARFDLEEAKLAVIEAIKKNNPEHAHLGDREHRSFLMERRYMDVEPVFEKAGWKVEFNKQCIGDNFASHYVFMLDK
jgi:hypothetical protein